MSGKLKTSIVSWSISADVECPHCKHNNNFMELDEWYLSCEVGQTIEEFEHNVEMTCDKCEKDFEINGSEY